MSDLYLRVSATSKLNSGRMKKYHSLSTAIAEISDACHNPIESDG